MGGRRHDRRDRARGRPGGLGRPEDRSRRQGLEKGPREGAKRRGACPPPAPPPLSEADARKYLKKRLREFDWRPGAVDAILSALESLDGFWSYGTNRVIVDLDAIYQDMVAEHGEP